MMRTKDERFKILNLECQELGRSCLTSRSVINLKIPADVSSERLSSALVQLFVFYGFLSKSSTLLSLPRIDLTELEFPKELCN